MDLINAQTGKLEDVPDDQVHSAYVAGTHNLPTGVQVPILQPDGSYSFVDSGQVDEVLKVPGTTIGNATEAQAQKDKQDYGGIGGQIAADAAGAVRGLSANLSDPLAIEASRAFGGDEAAEKTRQHLAGWQRVNPIGSKVSEIGGAIAGALATGGESALAEGAEGARLAEGAAEARPLLTKVLGYTPAGLASKAGSIASRAAEEVIGSKAASSALGRIAQAVAKQGAAGAVETSIYAGGGQLSEDALGATPVTAQKFIAAMGHGALWGLLLGGVAGGASAGAAEVAAPMLRKAQPFLEKQAGEQIGKTIGFTGKGAKEAEALGGVAEIGKTVINKIRLGEEGLHEAFITTEKMAPKLEEAISKQSKDIEAIFEQHGVAAKDVFITDPKKIEAIREQLKGVDPFELQTRNLPKESKVAVKEALKDMERLQLAQKVNAQAIESGVGKESGFQTAGLFHAVGNLAAGNPLAAAKSLVTAFAGKQLKANSGALAAATLTKISKMDLLARAVNSVDADFKMAAASLIGKPVRATAERFTGPHRDAPHADKAKHALSSGSSESMMTPDHLDKAIPGLTTHAPKVSKEVLSTLNKGAGYIASNKPDNLAKPTLRDPLPEPRYNKTDTETHYERVRAIEDPVGTLVDGITSGKLTQLSLGAIEATYPDLPDELRKEILSSMATGKADFSEAQGRSLEILFHGSGDEFSDPVVENVLQNTYTSKVPEPTPSPSAMKPMKGLGDSSMTRLEKGNTRKSHG